MEKISFKLYREFGALNSVPVFDAVSRGLKKIGFREVHDNEDIPVIWSVLWLGRMSGNRSVYQSAKNLGKPVIIIEVGNLKRNITWRVSLDNINGLGEFANNENLDENRPTFLGVGIKDRSSTNNGKILIATQHENSLQWHGQPPLDRWVEQVANQIKKYTDRRIVVRPHPRWPIKKILTGIQFERPTKLTNSYDDFDINYGYHIIFNHNSGPSVQSAINGTPVVCDPSSLAFPVSDKIENIENPTLFERNNWFLKLCHTEWTVSEISDGIPFDRLKSKIVFYQS